MVLPEIQRSVSSLRPSLDPTKKHIHKGNPAELQLPQTEGKRSMIKSSSAPSTNALQGKNSINLLLPDFACFDALFFDSLILIMAH